MRFGKKARNLLPIGVFLLFSTPLAAQATTHQSTTHHTAARHSAYHHQTHHYRTHAIAENTYLGHDVVYHHFIYRHGRVYRVARSSYRGIQCVTFARADSGIVLSGNAADWWNHAAGIYQRGARPEVGAVLNFRANPRMRLGHVAVVSNVVDARTVEIDQANWGGGSSRHGGYISRSTMVVDVSPNNDWTAVRVGLDHAGDYGSIYPTYGFIYARPDDGIAVASNTAAAPADTRNAAPSDLRRGQSSYDEVAETPQVSGVDTGASLSLDAPDRAIQ